MRAVVPLPISLAFLVAAGCDMRRNEQPPAIEPAASADAMPDATPPTDPTRDLDHGPTSSMTAPSTAPQDTPTFRTATFAVG